MPVEVYQVMNVLLETAATKTRAGIEKFGANPAVCADRTRHLTHIGTSGLAEGRDRIDRTDPLGLERVRSELGQLTAPVRQQPQFQGCRGAKPGRCQCYQTSIKVGNN